MLYVTDDNIKKFNNCDIKIKDVVFEKDPFSSDFVLTIYAWSIPNVQWYEEGKDSWFITSGDDMEKPVGYRIRIPLELYYLSKYKDFKDLFDFIDRSLPPLFEKYRFEIIDKVKEIIYSLMGERKL